MTNYSSIIQHFPVVFKSSTVLGSVSSIDSGSNEKEITGTWIGWGQDIDNRTAGVIETDDGILQLVPINNFRFIRDKKLRDPEYMYTLAFNPPKKFEGDKAGCVICQVRSDPFGNGVTRFPPLFYSRQEAYEYMANYFDCDSIKNMVVVTLYIHENTGTDLTT